MTPRSIETIQISEENYVSDYLRIEINDTGAGISEENQKRLFSQYVQFDAGKLQKGSGSGLGLWISKGIVALHGGELVIRTNNYLKYKNKHIIEYTNKHL